MINIKNLSFKYNNSEVNVLENVNFVVNSGIWLLEGENGSGKSTFLKIINDTYKDLGTLSEESELLVEGKKILLDNTTTLPLRLKEKDIAKYLLKINDINIIDEYIPIYYDRDLITYSTGELKLAILNILSYLKVDLLLMDEYISNIHEKNIGKVMDMLQKIADKGTIIILSSNEVDIKNRFKNKIKIQNKALCVNRHG